MSIDFYYMPPSPPSRSVMLLAKALDIQLNLKLTNTREGAHKTPEYTKMNPQQVIPTLDDDGFVIWESRAILGYLVNQYGKDDSLYPRDPKERALVDQRLYFDATLLSDGIMHVFKKAFFLGKPILEEDMQQIHRSLDLLNTFLNGQLWVAGPNMTIADFSIVVNVSNAEAFGIELNSYPNISNWYTRAKSSMPGYEEINQSGANILGEIYKNSLKTL